MRETTTACSHVRDKKWHVSALWKFAHNMFCFFYLTFEHVTTIIQTPRRFKHIFQFLVDIDRYTWTVTFPFASIFVSLTFSDKLQHLIFLLAVLQTFFLINAIALTRRGSVTSNCLNSWKRSLAQSHSSTFLHGQFSESIDSENE